MHLLRSKVTTLDSSCSTMVESKGGVVLHSAIISSLLQSKYADVEEVVSQIHSKVIASSSVTQLLQHN